MAKPSRRKRPRLSLPRSTLVFLLGIGIIVNEVVLQQARTPNSSVLLLGALLCGALPVEITERGIRKSVLGSLLEKDDDPAEPEKPT
jgi:hypothetical protein